MNDRPAHVNNELRLFCNTYCGRHLKIGKLQCQRYVEYGTEFGNNNFEEI